MTVLGLAVATVEGALYEYSVEIDRAKFRGEARERREEQQRRRRHRRRRRKRQRRLRLPREGALCRARS